MQSTRVCQIKYKPKMMEKLSKGTDIGDRISDE
jgi:hypothetical protein